VIAEGNYGPASLGLAVQSSVAVCDFIMRKYLIFIISCLLSAILFSSCSPRDFLTRRLAADLIAGSNTFRAPQQFWLRIGVLSNKDYLSPEYVVMQHRGWISAANVLCSPQVAPPPCWDVMLTPSGVDTVRPLVLPEERNTPAFGIPVARRELLAITSISKQGNVADVAFTWRSVPMNEFGSALYSSDPHYSSTAGFRNYDDGWRVLQTTPHSGQALDEALKNAEPVQ